MDGGSEPHNRSPREEAALLRQLTRAARGDDQNPVAKILGLVLGAAMAAAIGGALLLLTYGSGPPERVYGMVSGFGLADGNLGSRLVARVEVDDVQASVVLPIGVLCKAGDRIELMRAKALMGNRYQVGVHGCS
jgi:hypothetical protein